MMFQQPNSATRNRWMDWQPSAPILANLAKEKPSKPTELLSPTHKYALTDEAEGNAPDGPPQVMVNPEPEPGIQLHKPKPSLTFGAHCDKVDAGLNLDRDDRNFVRARSILNQAGVRKFETNGFMTIGLWSDLDGPPLRAALKALGLGSVPVRYLDGTSVPSGLKLRRVIGEPVSLCTLLEMEQSAEPWKVRDNARDQAGRVFNPSAGKAVTGICRQEQAGNRHGVH
jgi:hypothetical protein